MVYVAMLHLGPPSTFFRYSIFLYFPTVSFTRFPLSPRYTLAVHFLPSAITRHTPPSFSFSIRRSRNPPLISLFPAITPSPCPRDANRRSAPENPLIFRAKGRARDSAAPRLPRQIFHRVFAEISGQTKCMEYIISTANTRRNFARDKNTVPIFRPPFPRL